VMEHGGSRAEQPCPQITYGTRKSLEGDCGGGMLPLVGPCVCEVTHPSLSVRHPTDAVQENGSMGDKARPPVSLPAALLCEISPFVLNVTSRIAICAGRHFAKNRIAVRCVCV
jgi:hypothetical protein